jgi:DNA polymerase-3 subunit delta
MVDEFAGDDYELGEVVNAARTPPLFTDRRIVVARNAGRFTKQDDYAPLLSYLADPEPTTSLLVAWEKAEQTDTDGLVALPKKLADAVTACGGEVHLSDAPAPRKARADWLDEQFTEATVQLDREARRLVVEHLQEDVADLPALLARLAEAYGPGASVGERQVVPFLGQAGSVAPWELTDAVDSGDAALAIDRLHRMLGAGGRHPLQVLAGLVNHFGRMLRLDGAGVRDERQAAELLGMKGSTYPAKKALGQARRLGSARLGQATLWLAEADVSLKGARAWDGDLVLEVLVARLARQARATTHR